MRKILCILMILCTNRGLATQFNDITKISSNDIITTATITFDKQQLGQNAIIRKQLYIDSITDAKPYYIIYASGDSVQYKIASKFDSTKSVKDLSEIKVGDNILLELVQIFPRDSIGNVAVMRNLGIGLGFGPFILNLEQEFGYKIYTAKNLNGLYINSYTTTVHNRINSDDNVYEQIVLEIEKDADLEHSQYLLSDSLYDLTRDTFCENFDINSVEYKSLNDYYEAQLSRFYITGVWDTKGVYSEDLSNLRQNENINNICIFCIYRQ